MGKQLGAKPCHLESAQRELMRIERDRAVCAEQVDATPADIMDAQLQLALEARQSAEKNLAHKRDALESATQALRSFFFRLWLDSAKPVSTASMPLSRNTA